MLPLKLLQGVALEPRTLWPSSPPHGVVLKPWHDVALEPEHGVALEPEHGVALEPLREAGSSPARGARTGASLRPLPARFAGGTVPKVGGRVSERRAGAE